MRTLGGPEKASIAVTSMTSSGVASISTHSLISSPRSPPYLTKGSFALLLHVVNR